MDVFAVMIFVSFMSVIAGYWLRGSDKNMVENPMVVDACWSSFERINQIWHNEYLEELEHTNEEEAENEE